MVHIIDECTTLSELEDKCSKFIMAYEETGGYVPHIVRRIDICGEMKQKNLVLS